MRVLEMLSSLPVNNFRFTVSRKVALVVDQLALSPSY